MAGSVPLVSTAIVTAPKDYTLPQSQEIIPLAVTANIDGSGAGVTWFPALQCLAPNGTVMWTAVKDSVAAGGSADVSWFPGVVPVAQATPPAGGGTPSVATFYRSAAAGDAAQSIAGGGGSHTLAWPHAALPSDGSITGPSAFNFITINIDCMAIMWLRVAWEDGAYEKTAIIGTTSRIVQADVVSQSNYWPGASPLNTDLKDWVVDGIPNAFRAGNISFAYAVNGDAVAHDVTDAYLVYYVWPATGYNGNIPGWPQ
jgi:hypothetical protein